MTSRVVEKPACRVADPADPGLAGLIHSAFDAALLSRIEDAGLNASAPPQQRWVDGWLVRFSPGKAKRARCINAVAAGRLPLEQRFAACERLFAAAGLAPIVRVTPFSVPADLDRWLDARGLQRFDPTRVMLLPELSHVEPLPADVESPLQAVGLEHFAESLGALRGSPPAQGQAYAERLRLSPVPCHAFELRQRGAVVACGQFALEDDLAGLYDVFTAAPARRLGFAERLCRGLLLEARARGARHAYLQVDEANTAARALYRRLGFTDAFAYHYRARDPRAA